MASLSRLSLVLVFTATSLLAQSGSTYYVSKSGKDTNSGSYTAPWLTIQHAANSVSAGATVYVEAGVYNESVSFPKSGTASNYITFENYLGQTAVIDGTGLAVSGTQGLINIVNQSYITVSGFEIRNYTTSKREPDASGHLGHWLRQRSAVAQQPGAQHHHNVREKRQCLWHRRVWHVEHSHHEPNHQRQSGLQPEDRPERIGERGWQRDLFFHHQQHRARQRQHRHRRNRIRRSRARPGYDQAKYGEISGNTVYNISGIHNPGEGKSVRRRRALLRWLRLRHLRTQHRLQLRPEYGSCERAQGTRLPATSPYATICSTTPTPSAFPSEATPAASAAATTS